MIEERIVAFSHLPDRSASSAWGLERDAALVALAAVALGQLLLVAAVAVGRGGRRSGISTRRPRACRTQPAWLAGAPGWLRWLQAGRMVSGEEVFPGSPQASLDHRPARRWAGPGEKSWARPTVCSLRSAPADTPSGSRGSWRHRQA